MSELALFHFLRPGWLALLPLAVLIPWSWRRLQRPSGDWARVCDPHLLKWLSVDQGRKRRGGPGAWAAGLGLLLASLALAGPTWERLPESSFSARDARVIALDLSLSMLSGDLKPNRLTQARFRLADLLAATTEGNTGMVAFGGDAFIVSPLTSDTNTIASLLPALQPDIIPVAGSRADRALDLAAELLERTVPGLGTGAGPGRRTGAGPGRYAGAGEILLVADAADRRAVERAAELRDRGIVTSVLAVGTAQGAPIPSGNGFVTDRGGNVVIARLDAATLRELASVGGGRYTELAAGDGRGSPWAGLRGDRFERRQDALQERWQDAGPWLVLAVVPLLAAAFRRGLLFLLPLIMLPAMAPQPAQAGWWEDLWQRRDQQAWSALQEQEATRAAALARDPGLTGEAWYRAGEYGKAGESWAGISTAGGHYNRANALALQGRFDAAIAAYEQALEEDPEMLDALYNKNVIERLKKAQEQQQAESQPRQGQGGQQSEAGEESEQEPGEEAEQRSDPGEQSEQGEDQAARESEVQSEAQARAGRQAQLEQAWSEEDAQAMEQWLRRIPDDPGGLLRRKFRNEYQRRGAPEGGSESW